jgi:signal transduction histidine kinase
MISEAFLLRELGTLRTPVNDIIGFSEVITSEKFSPINPKYREFAEHIQQSARHLTNLSVEVINLLMQGINESKGVERARNIRVGSICEEIFTPLNATVGFSEMIMRELFGPIGDQYRTYVENIHASGILLNNVISDLHDLAILEAGVEWELDEESVDVEKVVQEALLEAVPWANQHQVTLTWVPSAAKLPNLYCGRRFLRRMLLNMLLSAAKFGEPGRMVEVGTDLSDGFAIFISDTGWALLTDPLRLILTKFLIGLHGGELSIVNAPNDGVTVRLSFPPERIIRSDGVVWSSISGI